MKAVPIEIIARWPRANSGSTLHRVPLASMVAPYQSREFGLINH